MIDTGYLKYCISIDPLRLKIKPGWLKETREHRSGSTSDHYTLDISHFFRPEGLIKGFLTSTGGGVSK